MPTLIRNLPEEALDLLRDRIDFFLQLPEDVLEIAEQTVDEAAKIFEDIGNGKILDDFKQLPKTLVNKLKELGQGWVNTWKTVGNTIGNTVSCLFHDCPAAKNDPSTYTCKSSSSDGQNSTSPSVPTPGQSGSEAAGMQTMVAPPRGLLLCWIVVVVLMAGDCIFDVGLL